MTSRERVAKAGNHQVPDRVPIDLGGMKASTIAAIAYFYSIILVLEFFGL